MVVCKCWKATDVSDICILIFVMLFFFLHLKVFSLSVIYHKIFMISSVFIYAFVQTSMEKNIFGNHCNPPPPPAFASSDPLIPRANHGNSVSDFVEIEIEGAVGPGAGANEVSDGGTSRQKSSMDSRKLPLLIGIMVCLATMAILYYRLMQRGLGEDPLNDE